MSNITDEGVMNVRQIACDILLEQRVEKKLRTQRLSKNTNRIHVAMPAPRDNKVRAPTIPERVLNKQVDMEEQLSTQDIMLKKLEERIAEDIADKELWARGEVPGMNSNAWKEGYMLADDSWKFDKIPEVIDGMNIADFLDPDIMEKLDELEKEEDERLEKLEADRIRAMEEDSSDLDEDQKALATEIEEARKLAKLIAPTSHVDGRMDRTRKRYTEEALEERMRSRGVQEDMVEEIIGRVRSRSRSRSESRPGTRKRERSESVGRNEEEIKIRKTSASRDRSRERSVTPGFKDLKSQDKAAGILKGIQKSKGKESKKGESDRHIFDLKPKHLNSGKRGIGKTTRR